MQKLNKTARVAILFGVLISAGCKTTGGDVRVLSVEPIPLSDRVFTKVKSREIKAVCFEPGREVVTVQFYDECFQEFAGLSQAKFDTFMATPGKKGYFEHHIKTLPCTYVFLNDEVKKKTRFAKVGINRYDGVEHLGFSESFTVTERE